MALDQRGILKNAIAREMGVADLPDSVVVEFKEIVTKALTQNASAILLDPEFGLPAAKHRHGKGLLLAYERSSYGAALPRMPMLYDEWSVRRVKEAGADAVKILLFFTPFETAAINTQKQAWTQRIGDECRANDIPFVLELVGYDANSGDEKSVEYARRKPEIVVQSIVEFSKDRYGVDLLKIEVPVLMKLVAGTRFFRGDARDAAYTQDEARRHFRAASTVSDTPFVYLSAGVSNAEFIEALEFAVASGAHFNGVLCGRATWQDGIPIFARQGAKALEQWLSSEGLANLARINDVLKSAQPWHEKARGAVPAAK